MTPATHLVLLVATTSNSPGLLDTKRMRLSVSTIMPDAMLSRSVLDLPVRKLAPADRASLALLRLTLCSSTPANSSVACVRCGAAGRAVGRREFSQRGFAV
jgi:hypothetical protein